MANIFLHNGWWGFSVQSVVLNVQRLTVTQTSNRLFNNLIFIMYLKVIQVLFRVSVTID